MASIKPCIKYFYFMLYPIKDFSRGIDSSPEDPFLCIQQSLFAMLGSLRQTFCVFQDLF